MFFPTGLIVRVHVRLSLGRQERFKNSGYKMRSKAFKMQGW
jgi:hypothetical protein